MHYVNLIIAVVLLVFAVVLLKLNDAVTASACIGGAVLAAVALKHWLDIWTVRLLALATAGMLFYCFAQFFSLVPTLQPGWYWQVEAINTFGLLFAGFAMIPVLSEYSCRMKANGDCERGRRHLRSRKPLLTTLRHSQTSRSTS